MIDPDDVYNSLICRKHLNRWFISLIFYCVILFKNYRTLSVYAPWTCMPALWFRWMDKAKQIFMTDKSCCYLWQVADFGAFASPAMGHWGTCPPRLPASYFGDQLLAHFCHFFAHSFRQGVIIVPKMPERSPINFNSTRTSDSGKTGS